MEQKIGRAPEPPTAPSLPSYPPEDSRGEILEVLSAIGHTVRQVPNIEALKR